MSRDVPAQSGLVCLGRCSLHAALVMCAYMCAFMLRAGGELFAMHERWVRSVQPCTHTGFNGCETVSLCGVPCPWCVPCSSERAHKPQLYNV